MVTLSTPPADAGLLAVRTPPHAVECEQSVLGGLLLDNAAYDRVADFLREEHFYRNDHRIIYRQILRLIDHNKPADALTVSVALGEALLRDVGGQSYIGSLALNTPSAANIRRYAEIVRERALLRGVIATTTELADKAYASNANAVELLENAAMTLHKLQEQGLHTEAVTLSSALTEAIEHIDKMYGQESKLAGISCGLHELDQLTGGLEPGDLLIVGARPSMGKTSLALGMAQDVASTATGKSVAFFSLEMSRKQIALRLLASSSGISMHALRTGTIAEEDWAGVVDHTAKLQELPLLIDDTPGITVPFMRTKLRAITREHGPLAMIVVDYLTLMNGDGHSPNERVETIAKGLKEIAKEFKAPMVVLAQLNRGVELRPNKRPTMADLRDSGAIEQAADIILLVYRDEVYHPDTIYRGIAELIVAKQRNGPTGTVHADFRAKRMRFMNRKDPLPVEQPPEPRGRKAVTNMHDYKKEASGDGKNGNYIDDLR